MNIIGVIIVLLGIIGVNQIKIFFNKNVSFQYKIEQVRKKVERIKDNHKLIELKNELKDLSEKSEYEYQKNIINSIINKIDFNLKFKVS